MISTLELQNFKNHLHTRMQLGRISALVGPNGSGKTSLLQALHYLSQLTFINCKDLFQYERNPEQLVTSGKTKFVLKVDGVWGKEKWHASLHFNKNEKSTVELSQWTPTIVGRWGDEQADEYIGWNASFGDLNPDINRALRNCVYLKIEASNLAEPSYTDNIPPRVEYNGNGLASTVAYLMTYETDTFKTLVDAVQQVVPAVRRIRVRPARVQLREQRLLRVDDKSVPFDDSRNVVGHELTLDMSGGNEIPAHAISEGTLLTIGLLTVLVSPTCPNLVLLDDIEQGLHPKAQRELMKLLSQLIKRRPYLQVVLTTHSPYVVDELSADDVWAFNTNTEGYVDSARLSQHPDAQRALEVLTTGEFLSAEGEAWVTK